MHAHIMLTRRQTGHVLSGANSSGVVQYEERRGRSKGLLTSMMVKKWRSPRASDFHESHSPQDGAQGAAREALLAFHDDPDTRVDLDEDGTPLDHCEPQDIPRKEAKGSSKCAPNSPWCSGSQMSNGTFELTNEHAFYDNPKVEASVIIEYTPFRKDLTPLGLEVQGEFEYK